MEIRIDQGRQRRRRLDGGVDLDAQFSEEREVGPKAGRNHDAVDDKVERLARQGAPIRARHRRLVTRSAANGASILRRPLSIAALGGEPQCTAFRQLVVQSAAKQLVDAVAAQCPEDLGGRSFILQLHQRQRDIDGRMACADHENALAGIVARTQLRRHVRNTIRDAIRRESLTGDGQTIDADRVRLSPGAGRIDDRARQQPVLAVVVGVADNERRLVATAGRHFVEAVPRDRIHRGAELEIAPRSPAKRRAGPSIEPTISPPVGSASASGACHPDESRRRRAAASML